jgi:glutamine synthetase
MTTSLPAADALLLEVRAFRQRHPDILHVDLIELGLSGRFHGKRYPIDQIEKIARGGLLKYPQNMLLLGTGGRVYRIDDYAFEDGDPDTPRRLVAGSLAAVGWQREPLAQMLMTSSGSAAPVCFEPREVLAQVLARLRAKGIHPTVAFELEFYLIDPLRVDGLPQAPRAPGTGAQDESAFDIDSLYRFSAVLDDIVRCARLQGIDTTTMLSEGGPSQFEINFNHSNDALRAADQSAMFSRVVRGVAAQHGCEASFMAKPYLAHPGSGLHLHVSLYGDAGENLLGARDGAALRHAVAGCLDWIPHTMPIFAPTHNAFRRYTSGAVNAAARASWGVENRDACLRIPHSEAADLRIEHRLAGADANPYLALACVLAAIEYGLEQGREPIASLNDERTSGVDFPTDMLDAVRQMEHADFVRAGLGAEFVNVYCKNRKQDQLAFMDAITARECAWFL